MAVIESGEVTSGASYTLPEFMRRTGMKRDAMRTARRNGLQVSYLHGRAFVLGKHWLDYLEAQASQQA